MASIRKVICRKLIFWYLVGRKGVIRYGVLISTKRPFRELTCGQGLIITEPINCSLEKKTLNLLKKLVSQYAKKSNPNMRK